MQRTFAVVAVLLAWTKLVCAAEIQAVSTDCFFFDRCEQGLLDSILIRGTLAQGDADRFRNAAKQGGLLTSVILRSRGGNVFEAMKIGRDIRRLLLETEGPLLDYLTDRDGSIAYGGGDYPLCIENGMGKGTQAYKGSRYKGSECVCASACFLIYVAGARRDRSYVGIHRSHLSENDLGLEATSQLYSRLQKPIMDYLDDMGVPRRYADIMMRTSSREIYFPKLREIMSDFYGWVPAIEEWLLKKCNTISERQLQEEEIRAFAAGRVMEFIEFRNRRESCIQLQLLSERAKRRSEY